MSNNDSLTDLMIQLVTKQEDITSMINTIIKTIDDMEEFITEFKQYTLKNGGVSQLTYNNYMVVGKLYKYICSTVLNQLTELKSGLLGTSINFDNGSEVLPLVVFTKLKIEKVESLLNHIEGDLKTFHYDDQAFSEAINPLVKGLKKILGEGYEEYIVK